MVMQKLRSKRDQYRHTFFLILGAQAVLLLIATLINAIFLLPNNFKQKYLDYQSCLKQNKGSLELSKVCPKPFTNN